MERLDRNETTLGNMAYRETSFHIRLDRMPTTGPLCIILESMFDEYTGDIKATHTPVVLGVG